MDGSSAQPVNNSGQVAQQTLAGGRGDETSLVDNCAIRLTYCHPGDLRTADINTDR